MIFELITSSERVEKGISSSFNLSSSSTDALLSQIYFISTFAFFKYAGKCALLTILPAPIIPKFILFKLLLSTVMDPHI